MLLISGSTKARNSLLGCDCRRQTDRHPPCRNTGLPASRRPRTRPEGMWAGNVSWIHFLEVLPPGEGAATELAGERGKDTDTTVGGGWLPWRRPLCSSHPGWEQTSPSPPPFPAGEAVITPRQTGQLPREAVVLREMIVQVSTTCCFSEPWGQRPGRSTMAFSG